MSLGPATARTVGDEAETVGPDAPEHLYEHVGQVEAEEEEDLGAVRILEDRLHAGPRPSPDPGQPVDGRLLRGRMRRRTDGPVDLGEESRIRFEDVHDP